MRVLKLKVENPNTLLLNLPPECSVRCKVEDENTLSFVVENDCIYMDIEFRTFSIIIAKYLYDKITIKQLEKHKAMDKHKMYLEKYGIYTVQLLTLKLELYFLKSDTLNEKSFLTFNLNGIVKEIEGLVTVEKMIDDEKKNLKELTSIIKKNGKINISDFEEVFIDYDENIGVVISSSKTGDHIDMENVVDKLGVSLMKKFEDQWQQDVNFCLLCLLTLNVKKLVIYDDLIELLTDMEQNPLYKSKNIKIEVIPNDN